jgi:ribonuclease HI
MQYLVKNNETSCTLYSDSRVAIKRIHEKTIRTTLPRNNSTHLLWVEIDRQLKRLQENKQPIVIKKRKTKDW